MNKAREFDQSVLGELRALLGERVTTSAGIREHHGKDESYFPYAAPDAVVFPHSTEEVRDIVNICRRHRVPMIPYGVGTSLEGHILATQGGVCIDMGQMNRVLAVHEEDLDAVVQAGVTRKQLNEFIKHTGLFFPIDPGADATLGGMSATRASGTNAVRYGTMRENVLSLKVVLADGRVIQTARRSKKSAAGYDLTRLFVGSEGTLGIITEVTVKLHPVQAAMSAAVCAFETVKGAADTVIQTLQSAIPIARSELLCATTMAALNRHNKTNHREMPTLLLEFHGTEAGVVEQAEMVQSIAANNGGGEFKWATRPEERSKLWTARHDVTYANKALRPGCEIWATDVCVPISRLADCVVETEKDLLASPFKLPAPIVGHVGDGNFHTLIAVPPEEYPRAESFAARLGEAALKMGGTVTGEHGIGLRKRTFLPLEHPTTHAWMARLKELFDPHGILNPGKVIPAFSLRSRSHPSS